MLAQMKFLLWRLFRRFGVDVRPAKRVCDVIDFINDREIDTVLDVGANVGQFGGTLRAKGYRGKIVSFEPVNSAYKSLSGRARADGNWDANNFALGAAAGETTINVADSSVFSSILPSTGELTQFDGGSAVTHTERIRLKTLDEVAPRPAGQVLLKIDTQGYEKQVLEGGPKTLAQVSGVLMELPIVNLYEGTWRFHEALKFMSSAGFTIAQFHPVNYHSEDKVSLVEVDCLFRRTSMSDQDEVDGNLSELIRGSETVTSNA